MSTSPHPSASVQLTPIVPVRVYNLRGDFFDTEVDIDAPLRAMQLAIEDYFKIKPEVQLLMHNRQQIHADHSLRDNGCLMLKGDPHIKIVCAIKRGPVLNLQCQVGAVTYVVACHETCTVWEVKQLLCEEMDRQQRRGTTEPETAPRRSAVGPERLRLLWRYLELNDRATLHYYRVPTNAVLQVMHRRRAVGAPPGTAPPAAAFAPPPVSQPTVWWQRPTASAPTPSYPAAVPPPPPPSLPPAAYDDGLARAAVPAPPSVAYAAASHSVAVPPPPQLTVGASQHHDPHASAEVADLAARVRLLEGQLRALWQALQEQQQVGEYQRGSLADTHQRILELQQQMEHVLWLQQETARLLPS